MARKHVNISPWKHPPHSASKYGWMFDMRRWSRAGASYDVIWLSVIWSICDASCWSTNALSTGCPPSISGKYSGRFWSPSYPRNYPNNKNCNWRITVPDGYSVKVVFSHFNTEEGYDYLRIYDGPSASSRLLEKLSDGLSTPRGVISTGSSLWINFLTDGSVSRQGFEAAFTAVNSSLLGKSPWHGYDHSHIRQNNPGKICIYRTSTFHVPRFNTRTADTTGHDSPELHCSDGQKYRDWHRHSCTSAWMILKTIKFTIIIIQPLLHIRDAGFTSHR